MHWCWCNWKENNKKYKKKYLGTIGDVGGFSLNYHKAIHCGEGGVAVTNSDNIATRLKLIRNHGESVADSFNIILRGENSIPFENRI